MPRYPIERKYDLEKMPTAERESKRIAADTFPDIVWEHSHVVVPGTSTGS